MVIVQYIKDLLELLPSHRLKKKKNDLRAYLGQRRRILYQEQVIKASEEIIEQLRTNQLYQNASCIMVYYPMKNEVDLRPLMNENSGKRFFLPVTHRRYIEVREYKGETNLKKGRYRIPEPQTPTYKGKLDLIIVPGVAFDHKRYRLGRGGGYYDRFLKKFTDVPKIGVAYKFQVVSELPVEPHDIKMTQLIVSQSV
ncbi:MAG: 5-formyltetrahydrofolate cyclo-ligase [Paludibacteraceae bacterium]|nr:5-formyltetrahydrofolate cyclo-ligase [Paludibacteraceae bacterium]